MTNTNTAMTNFQLTLEKQNYSNAAANKRAQMEGHIKAGQEFNLSYGKKALVEILPVVEDFIKAKYAMRNQHTQRFFWNVIKPLHEAGEKPEMSISEVVAVNLVGSLSKQTGFTQAADKMARNTLITLNVPFDQRPEYKDSALQFFATVIQHVAEMTDIYTVEQINGREYFLFVSDKWKDIITDAQDKFALNVDNFAPMIVKPRPHKDLFSGKGGYLHSDSPLMKDPAKVKGRMPQELRDFNSTNNAEFFGIINASQEVPYCVNIKLLRILASYYQNGMVFNDFPVQIQEDTAELEAMKEVDERNARRQEYAEKNDIEYKPLLLSTINEVRRKYLSRQVEAVRKTNALFEQAEFYTDFEEMFFPVFMDHRGRRYPYATNGLTIHGDEMAKALVQLANKRTLTEAGLQSLMETLGNCLGHDKLACDKKADEALKWWNTNVDTFKLGDFSMFFFDQDEFEEPINALAIVLELLEWTKDPENFKCGYIAHRDARVSGSSIIGTILRDRDVMEMTSVMDWVSEEGKLKDAYTSVAQSALVKAEALCAQGNELAAGLLTHVDVLFTRKAFKKLVMCRVSYGLTDYSTRDHTAGLLDWEKEMTFEHKRLFDEITFEALDTAMPSCSGYLDAAKTAGNEVVKRDGHLSFISPINGFPVFFHTLKTKDRVIEVNTGFSRIQLKIISHTNKPDNAAMVREVAPGLIHHCDSALLYLVNKFAPTIDLAMIHDSVGSHPNDVREVVAAYAKAMYVFSQSDVFDKIFDQFDTAILVPKVETATAEDCRSILNSKHVLC